MRIGGISLNSINTVDESMDKKWLCGLCVLEWKHKYHTLGPQDADLTSVNLHEMMLATIEKGESRDLYLEWVAEQEGNLVVHDITKVTDEDIESILQRAFGEEGQ